MTIARIGVMGLLAGAAVVTGGWLAMGNAKTAVAAETQLASLPATADNFMLVDAGLGAHELYRMGDAKAIVLVSYGVGCPIVRAMTPQLKALRDQYAKQGVEFMLLDSNLQDGREAVLQEAKEFGQDIPVLMDTNQLVGESLGVTRTAEVFVINPKTWQIVYRGPLDDRIDYGGVQKANVTPYAANALDAVIAGKTTQQVSMATKGCLVDFPERAKHAQFSKISYAKQIAPILEKNCVGCHQEGSIGPFAMDSYEKVKGFSPMIRETIRTDRMPPYNADPHVGKFSDNKNLSSADIKTLVHWIEAGAPRGAGPDPLAAKRHIAPEWPLGKPDLVLNVPTYKIPASGVVDYQHPYVVSPLTEGRWLKASTVKVGSRQGVHHILTGYMKEVPKDGKGTENRWGVSVGGYAVGAESEVMPKNTGAYLPPGGAIGMQVHYTPFGKDVEDKSQIALYFYKDNEKPDLVMHNSVIADQSIALPANDGNHLETAYLEFPKDALLTAAFPHAHYRGKASDLWIRYPDGKEKLLLSLPRYDFSWQRDYTFAEPIKVPAGSKLIAHFWYDNSKRNPNNPDSNKQVVWGDQSWEEMFYVAVKYRWVGEDAKHLVNYDDALQSNRMMGMLDDSTDGKLQKAELKGRIGQMLGQYFTVLDKNNDGGIDNVELAAAQGMMGNRRRAPAAAPTAQAAPTTGGR